MIRQRMFRSLRCVIPGLAAGEAEQALTLAARDPRVRALSIGELNPTRSAGDPGALPRFADSIARILAVTGRR